MVLLTELYGPRSILEDSEDSLWACAQGGGRMRPTASFGEDVGSETWTKAVGELCIFGVSETMGDLF